MNNERWDSRGLLGEGRTLASLSRDLAFTRFLVKVNIFYVKSLKVWGLGGAAALERVAGPDHRCTRALWAEIFGLYLPGSGSHREGLAGYLVEQNWREACPEMERSEQAGLAWMKGVLEAAHGDCWGMMFGNETWVNFWALCRHSVVGPLGICAQLLCWVPGSPQLC